MEQEGVVYKSTGSWYVLRTASGDFVKARIKGRFKVDKEISSTNPIAVGDHVLFETENDQSDNAIICDIKARDNYIIRVSPHNQNQKHIIASNLSLALLITTLTEPRTSMGFVDRFLITAEAYHVPTIIVINKIDLLKDKHKQLLAHWQKVYGEAGYDVYPVIGKQPETLKSLSERLAGNTTLFSGHSGVGKSTLINQLIPGKDIKTLEVSGWSGKGQHTTTFAEMYDLPSGGRIIDTPGVKEFGLIDFKKEELGACFPELRKRAQDCKFNNCLHINEPGCAVKEAVAAGAISEDRYVSYVSILEGIEEKW